jgi:exonuclease SbcD
VPLAREILDLEPIEADGLSAGAVDALIRERVAAISGGVADKVVRQLVQNIPRHVARELDHAAVRALKAAALHFHLDLRRPEVHRLVGVGAPGRRQTLPELVRTYLTGRPLPAELDREAFVRLGEALMDSVERDLAGA